MQLALPGCVAVTVYSIVPNRATRDNRIGSCVKSPLKRYVAVVGVIDFIEDRAHAVVQQIVIEIEPVYEHAQGNDAQRADEKLFFISFTILRNRQSPQGLRRAALPA